jgi:hypothetical protein
VLAAVVVADGRRMGITALEVLAVLVVAVQVV